MGSKNVITRSSVTLCNPLAPQHVFWPSLLSSMFSSQLAGKCQARAQWGYCRLGVCACALSCLVRSKEGFVQIFSSTKPPFQKPTSDTHRVAVFYVFLSLPVACARLRKGFRCGRVLEKLGDGRDLGTGNCRPLQPTPPPYTT